MSVRCSTVSTPDDTLNLYQMIDQAELGLGAGYPIFVRRNSWGPRTVAEVIVSDPDWKQWPGNPPYWSNYPTIVGLVHWQRSGAYELAVLSSPGTFAYTRIDQPSWWNPPRTEYVLDVGGHRVTHFHIEYVHAH